jgi:hypothetical protein
MTLRDNPLTISLGLIVGAVVFVVAFTVATLEGEAKW